MLHSTTQIIHYVNDKVQHENLKDIFIQSPSRIFTDQAILTGPRIHYPSWKTNSLSGEN